MFKTFIFGILLGVGAAAAALYYIPVVDQFREQSLIVVHPNHGNTETFHINVPTDRIMIGAASQSTLLPPGLDWPADPLFSDVRSELFKLRNGSNAVVGVASRLAASDPLAGDVIEWVFHLPARGSVYVSMEPSARDGGSRIGSMRSGTREFAALTGQVTEQWIAETSGNNNASAGRIQLITAFVGQDFDQ